MQIYWAAFYIFYTLPLVLFIFLLFLQVNKGELASEKPYRHHITISFALRFMRTKD
jgi:hypothetical protein